MAYEESPARKSRRAAAKRRQERRWARKSGPVTVRFVDPSTLRPGTSPTPTQPQQRPTPQPPH